MTGEDKGAPRPSRRRRPLKAEERELWDYVTRSIRPLRPEPAPAESEAATTFAQAMEQVEKSDSPPVPKAPPSTVTPVRLPGPPPLAPIEPKLRRRLSRGAAVDARLDLHGLTQAAAHSRLNAFLRGAQGSGHAVVLVITGKGGTGGGAVFAGDGERGVLRRLVPQWLSAPELRSIVLGFETAGRGHGGEGALYVRLRRVREGRI